MWVFYVGRNDFLMNFRSHREQADRVKMTTPHVPQEENFLTFWSVGALLAKLIQIVACGDDRPISLSADLFPALLSYMQTRCPR